MRPSATVRHAHASRANVAALELREGMFEFVDNHEHKRSGPQRLFPVTTVIGDKRIPPRA
jgi:dihydroorotase